MLQAAARAVQFDTSSRILGDLKVDSAILDRLTGDFGKIYDENTFDVYTFRESRGLGIPFFAMGQVVKDSSARLGYGREQVDFINADHRQMCRFAGRTDQGYLKIVNALTKFIRAKCKSSGLDDENFLAAFRDLHAPEAQLRIRQVGPALKETFEWLLTNQALGFQSWLQSDHSLYWIRGKPASGKSTLMKLVLEDQRTTEAFMRNDAKCSTAAFFFHDRGGDVQTSFEGLVRSIIHQILSDIPELKTTVYEAYKLREGE